MGYRDIFASWTIILLAAGSTLAQNPYVLFVERRRGEQGRCCRRSRPRRRLFLGDRHGANRLRRRHDNADRAARSNQ